MEPSPRPLHLRIHVYDDGPPPAEPTATSLCPAARSHRPLTTDDDAQVSCRECLGIMMRLLL